jgi:hypothetical protein
MWFSTRILRIDGRDIPKEKTSGVDVMHQYLVDQETLELTKMHIIVRICATEKPELFNRSA